MPSLTVWRFSTPLAVDAAELRLKRLEELHAIVVHDSASVIWFADAERPRVRHRHSRGKDATSASFWGAALGMVFLAPVAGAAVGAAAGALAHRLRDAGVDDDFLDKVRSELTPGTSALFVLSSDAKLEEVRRMLAREPDIVLIHAELTDDAKERFADLLPPEAPAG